ncbi:hypothetical protein CJ030_MR8G000578 [Morella rubra]|uniref:Uncharacterized protein n=1 Tax=Morella rubra TaxID=262757 RepID=A0A6A1USQ9_9ROSI|nr:hypothetical protein CJ030_MR8G000569 [Morella rubra]KAB1203429.1 hypothetical protein CJ030_MR8G000578 [Morella rubra]
MDNFARATLFLSHQWRRLFSHAQLPFNVTFNILRCNFQQPQMLTSNPLRHAILVFIIPILINFIELKFEGKPYSPFETHPITTMVAVTSLLVYCLAYGADLTFSPGQRPSSRCALVLRSLIGLFGSLSLASLASILFPASLQSVPYIVYISLWIGDHELRGMIQKLGKWIRQRTPKKPLSALHAGQYWRTRSTRHPLLPLTATHS